MMIERSTHHVRLGLWLAVCGLWLSAGVVDAQDFTSPIASDLLTQGAQAVQGADAAGAAQTACEFDPECGDGDACTVDICDEGICSNVGVSGCVSCELGYLCPKVELVFVMDTSGSMGDEAATLCSTIDQIVSNVEAKGIDVTRSILGITETPGGTFSCLTDNVVSLLGGSVPDGRGTCEFPGGTSAFESWGPATAIVASRFDWTAGATHIIVPISDEGPCNGNRPDGCNDPGDDRDSIEDAILAATGGDEPVIVSPITGSGSNSCTRTLAEDLAGGTGGIAFHTQDASLDIPNAIVDIILASCEPTNECDDGNSCTDNDVCADGVCTGTVILGCTPCTPSGFCSDGNACTTDECTVDMECVSTPNYDDSVDCCNPSNGDLTQIDDGNQCANSACDPLTGEVTYIAVDDGTVCNDSLFCTVGEACQGGICGGSSPYDCSELDDQCHLGACNEERESCEMLPAFEDQPCDDSLFCTEGEVCQAGICSGGSSIDCSEFDDQCNVGACDETADACRTQPAHEDQSCDDGLFCTDDDTCVGGECAGGPPHDCGELDDECLVGVCNENLQSCQQNPRPQGTQCDDSDDCTVSDVCGDDGVCGGTDINSLDCQSDDECFGAVCDGEIGSCFCTHTPDLSLVSVSGELPGGTCFQADEQVAVYVELGPSTAVVTGGQFYIEYDPTVFEFVEMVPGSTVDSNSPFSSELSLSIDDPPGTIFYAVGIATGGTGTRGPAIMAALTLQPISTCVSGELCFLNVNPLLTRLTENGNEVEYIPSCTGKLSILGEPPVMNCPASTALNADAGEVTAEVTWDGASFSGGCEGEAEMECSATSEFGVNIDHLIVGGGTFPSGLSEFECTVTDICGESSACSWTIEVRPENAVEVSIELSPLMDQDPARQPLGRCIELEFFSNCAEPPVRIREVLDFGLPFNLVGHAERVLMKIPAGRYACVTARDPLHTLRSVSGLVDENGVFSVEFTGDPHFGGNWLVGGNLNDDNVIDILDFGAFVDVYLGQYDSNDDGQVDGDTSCETPAPHGDLNGDGIVDVIDFSFLADHFLMVDKDSCCPGSIASAQAPPVTEITVRQLERMGLNDLVGADLNGDGVLDTADLAAFFQGYRPAKRLPAGRGRSRR